MNVGDFFLFFVSFLPLISSSYSASSSPSSSSLLPSPPPSTSLLFSAPHKTQAFTAGFSTFCLADYQLNEEVITNLRLGPSGSRGRLLAPAICLAPPRISCGFLAPLRQDSSGEVGATAISERVCVARGIPPS